jgi:hypothetical protein
MRCGAGWAGRSTLRQLRQLPHVPRRQHAGSGTLFPPAPSVAVMNARLYPANEQAQPGGMAVGQVTNFLDGKGAFTVTIGGEQFSGEATRAGRSSREGIANAMGSRGGTMSCTYVLNNATQGSGQCTVNSGARYQLHLGG